MTIAVGGAAARGADGPAVRETGDDGAREARRMLAIVLAAVNVPIVVATVRALARGWQPIGDNGILLVRARDVGTSHNPLLGTWTSASTAVGHNLNNPGPLYYDALAPVIRVLGPWVGLAVGVMLINMAASSLSIVVARRLGGTEAMAAVAVVVVGIQWAMGSEALFDVWQPNALVLPFFAFLVVVCALAAGDLVMAPVAVGLGSLILQTHMSHAVLVVVLVAASVALCVWARRRGDEPTRWRRPLLLTAVVGALAWVFPVYEQLTSTGRGNIARIVDAARARDAATFGPVSASRIVAEITAVGPWFTRRSYAGAVPTTRPGEPLRGVVAAAPAVAILLVIIVVVVLLAGWHARSGRSRYATLTGMAGLAFVTGLGALATSPINAVAVSLHQMRWVWPIAALVSAAALTALFVAVRDRPWHRHVVVGVTAAVALVALANLPTHRSLASLNEEPEWLAAGVELMGQLDGLEGRGTVLYDTSSLRLYEPISGMTFAELQDRGIPFVFTDEIWIRHLGEGRRDDGSATLRVWQVQGSQLRHVPEGAERIAQVESPAGPIAILAEPIEDR